MKMLGNGAVGSRRRYLAEQAIFMEETFGKAAGFTTPITKPVASFKAPAGAAPTKPKTAALKPTGATLPSASQRLSALRQNLQTAGPSSTPPANAAGAVGKSDRLRRRGKFQSQSASSPVARLSRERVQSTPAEPLDVFTKALRLRGDMDWYEGTSGVERAVKEREFTNSAGKRRRTTNAEMNEALGHNKAKWDEQNPIKTRPIVRGPQAKALKPGFKRTAVLGGRMIKKREPLKTSISEDDARKLVDRHGLKGPLPKGLDREQKMAAYEARYVTAGGKKAEKWNHRAQAADKIKTGGLGVATVGGAAWLGARGKGYRSLKSIKALPLHHHAETAAAAGATAGGAAELYAAHARRKRSSYASAPAGVAASSLRRMRDYTP